MNKMIIINDTNYALTLMQIVIYKCMYTCDRNTAMWLLDKLINYSWIDKFRMWESIQLLFTVQIVHLFYHTKMLNFRFPISVWFMWFITGEYHLVMKYVWVGYFADVLAVASSHSVNPLIYGLLNKQLLPFWKCCCEKKQKTQESQAAVVALGETRTAHRLHAL